MTIERAQIMHEALKEIGVEVWRSLRYANDSGTCLRCSSGSTVLIPDDQDKPYVVNGPGAEDLAPQLDPVFARLLEETTTQRVDGDPRATLLAAADALAQESYDSGHDAGYATALNEARAVFQKIITRKFGAIAPSVASRIATASFEDMSKWADRFSTARHANAIVI